MLYKLRFLLYGFLIFSFLMIFALLFATFSDKGDPIGYGADKKDINGVFTQFEGKIYALVPSNGYYEVKNADPTTFQTFKDNYQNQHIGYDEKYVYAGNIILEGLNPKTLKSLGSNYYTDGAVTYYCNRNSDNNENLSAVGFIIRMMGQGIGLADKPQNYWYPFVKLPQNKTYLSKNGSVLGVNDQTAFFEGLEMKNANPNTIRPLKAHYLDRDTRDSQSYFTDGKNIYYKNNLLPMTYNETIHETIVEGDIPSRSAYLMDTNNGMVYVDGKPFDDSKAPYRLLGMNLGHAYQVFFVAKDGLYFYNTEADEVERTGDNPFANNQFDEIAPDVFTSGNKIYFLKATEQRSTKRGLHSRTTDLLELKDVQASSLKNISHQNSYNGSVWQSGNRYFYFDDLGSSQLMDVSVYEINDIAALKVLLNTETVGTDVIRNLKRDGKIIPAEGEQVLKAVTAKANSWYSSYWLIFGAVILVYVISFLFRNVKMHPFFIKDGFLVMNNFLFRKYKIDEIEKVVFRSVRTNYKSNGYSGLMRIELKNGKSSRNNMFTTRMTLTSETDTQVIVYIRELQKTLKESGIDSEFAG